MCTRVVQIVYDEAVKSKPKSSAKARPRSIRQSVTIPAPLAMDVRRVANERRLTMSRALVTLAEQGLEAEAAARTRLTSAYQEFMAADGSKKEAAGKDLMQAIFGRDAIAED